MRHLHNPYPPRSQFIVALNGCYGNTNEIHDYDYRIDPVFEDLIGGTVLLGWKHTCQCGESYIDGLSIPQVIMDDK